MRITERTDVPRKETWYVGTMKDGTKYSIVNLSNFLGSNPFFSLTTLKNLFLGWEAMKMNKDGSLDGEPIRESTREFLEETLMDMHGEKRPVSR